MVDAQTRALAGMLAREVDEHPAKSAGPELRAARRRYLQALVRATEAVGGHAAWDRARRTVHARAMAQEEARA